MLSTILVAASSSAGFSLEKEHSIHPPYGDITPILPAALDVSPTGHLYLLNARLAVIIKMTRDGEVIRQIGGPGSGAEQFSDPADLCAISGLNVYVADRGNDRIVRFDRELTYLAAFKSLEGTSFDLTFEFPQSVLIGLLGDLYIGDGGNDRILKIDPEGRPAFSFGEYGGGFGALAAIQRLELDPRGGLWALDQEGQVTRFDEFGGYLRQLEAVTAGNPTGLAISNQYVWVSSDSNLWQFDRDLREITNFTREQLNLSTDVTLIDLAYRKENLWILDSKGSIHRYKLSPTR
ncbi:NHL repeat-containing protein [bacterium]|nr:NHL repeat-containing protein [bacterium]